MSSAAEPPDRGDRAHRDPVVRGRRRRNRRLAWLAGALVVVAFGAYVVWAAAAVRADLVAAQDHARALERAVMDGDDAATDRELAALRERSDDARSRVDGPLWSVGAALPILGDDVDAVREISALLGDLVEDGITPLVESGVTFEPEVFAPRAGRVPLEPIVDLADGVELAAPAFATAGDRVRAIDEGGLLGPIATQVVRLRDELLPVTDAVEAAGRAVAILPAMLGVDERRDYVVLFQNPAEARGGGGLVGSAAQIIARDGQVRLGPQAAVSGEFPERDAPVLPLSDAEETLYDEQLGTYFVNASFTPDFPRTAELARAHWEEQYADEVGDGLDGVISLDPVALSYLLAATGPVEVGGRTLTADNVVDLLLNEVYLEVAAPAEQDAFFAAATGAIFERFTDGIEDPRAFLDGMTRATREGRLLVHSFAPDEQERISGTRVAGELAPPDGPAQVDLSVNDATASKMSYYLDYDVALESTSCRDGGVQQLEGRAEFRSSAPEDGEGLTPYIVGSNRSGIARGSQLLIVRLHAPAGGEILEVRVDGEVAEGAAMAVENGRPAGVYTVFLDPGDRIPMTWTVRTGTSQRGDVRMRVTPGIAPVDKSSIARSSCD